MATKIAIVGVGKIAVDQHLPAIAASQDWELAATVSRNASVAGVENFTSITEMLQARPDIPVVSLCIPPVPRFDYAVEILRAGRHIMLEKPPGATLSEVHILQQLAKDAGVSMFATWHSREAADVAEAKRWMAGKTLKKLHITWKEDVRRWHPGQEWIWQAGGLGVFDPGINALSILTEILHDPVHLKAADLLFPENRATPIAATLNFVYPNGAEVTADFDWRQKGEQVWEIEAVTDAGVMKLIDGGASLLVDGQPYSVDGPDALSGEYPRLYAHMARLVDQNTSDVDLRPMSLVLDAFTLGNRRITEPFYD
jgi:D-galactose 1-dehydrogenase